MLCIRVNVFVISGESHFCSSQSKPCVNPARSLLRCVCWVYNPASFFLSSQSRANNHMEEDKRQHPQKSEASEVSGRAGNSQHSAGGLGNVRVQSRESKRRHRFQRTPAGLQWVGGMLSFSVRVLSRGCFQGMMVQTTIKILQKPFHFCTVSKDFSWYNLSHTHHSETQGWSPALRICWAIQVHPSHIIQERSISSIFNNPNITWPLRYVARTT